MAIKRSSSAKENIKKKTKLDSEVTDYTTLLTSEDPITIESGDEFDDAEKPEKIKSAKKVQSTKKKMPKNDVENKVSKKTKGKPNTSNGKF